MYLTHVSPQYAAILEMRSKYKTPFSLGFEKKRKALYADADVEGAGDQLKRLRVFDLDNNDHQTQVEDQQPTTKELEQGEHEVMNVSDISKDP